MPMEVIFRPAAVADTEGVCRVIKAVYDEYGFSWDPDDYHWDLYNLKEAYFDLGNEFYVAELGGEIVGTAALDLFAQIEGQAQQMTQFEGYVRIAGCDCSLERLYVHPNGRRLGVGRTLTEIIINRAKELNRSCMEIWSDKKFVDAHRLYAKLGAVVVGERICDDPEESPEWGLCLPLRMQVSTAP